MSGMMWFAIVVGVIWLLIAVVVVCALLRSPTDRELGFHQAEVQVARWS